MFTKCEHDWKYYKVGDLLKMKDSDSFVNMVKIPFSECKKCHEVVWEKNLENKK